MTHHSDLRNKTGLRVVRPEDDRAPGKIPVHDFDSGIYNCQWHRIEFPSLALPAGAQLSVLTFATNDKALADDTKKKADKALAEENGGSDSEGGQKPHSGLPEVWSLAETLLGEDKCDVAKPVRREILVQSGPGRFLLVDFILRWNRAGSDTSTTAETAKFFVTYPRESWLGLLPAVFRSNPVAASFLERFLAVFQVDTDKIEHDVAHFRRYLDPELVPDAAGLRYLADWFDVRLEGNWSLAAKRRFLGTALHLRSRRGTPDAVVAFLQAWFECEGVRDVRDRLPKIVEGFRIRRFIALGKWDRSRLRRSAPLGAETATAGAQLDVGDKLGCIALPGPRNEGPLAMVNEFGNRMRIYVPGAWLPEPSKSAASRDLPCARPPRCARFRRFLADVIPGNLDVTICPVVPGFRLGVDSLLGLNTVPAKRPSNE